MIRDGLKGQCLGRYDTWITTVARESLMLENLYGNMGQPHQRRLMAQQRNEKKPNNWQSLLFLHFWVRLIVFRFFYCVTHILYSYWCERLFYESARSVFGQDKSRVCAISAFIIFSVDLLWTKILPKNLPSTYTWCIQKELVWETQNYQVNCIKTDFVNSCLMSLSWHFSANTGNNSL